MATYPYTHNTGNLKKFLEKAPEVGIPDKVTTRLVYSLGFKSTNDRAIPTIMKFLKFTDESGIPTERYNKFRDKSMSKKVLGAAIQDSYAQVFKMYPNAVELANTELGNFFSTDTGLGQRAVKSIVNTFKALCSIATFDKLDVIEESMEENEESESLPKSSLHKLDLTLSEGRNARIIVPNDIKESEIEKLKKLLDVLK
jgi:hypothetical protein